MYRYGVFVSYSHSDSTFAQAVVDSLTPFEPFIDVWIDKKGIRPTDRWLKTIFDALADRELLILFLSPEAMQSVNVGKEYTNFLTAEKPILSLYYREADLPDEISAIQYIDCRTYDTAPENHEPLLADIIKHVWRKRFEWLTKKFAAFTLKDRLRQAQKLFNADEPQYPPDPQAVELWAYLFETTFRESGRDETLCQWYIHFLCQSDDEAARETLQRLQRIYNTPDYPLLRQSFEDCQLLKGSNS